MPGTCQSTWAFCCQWVQSNLPPQPWARHHRAGPRWSWEMLAALLGTKPSASCIPAGMAAAGRSQWAPAQTRSPGGTAAPSPWRCAPRRLSPFYTPTTCKVPLRPSLVPAVCLPCAYCVPVMHQSCAHHVPARTDAELLCLLCCTGQLMQQNRSRDSSPARQNLSPHYLAPHFCPRLRFWESRGG